MTSNEKLEPCPFCGGQASLYERSYTDQDANLGNAYVECRKCGLESPWGQTVRETITAWNTRTQPDAQPDVVEALDMCRDLICEAKGAEGPNGGFVTNHLDAAETWLDVALKALASSEARETQLRADDGAGRLHCVNALIEFHETGGHRGDGSDACLCAARSELTSLTAENERLREREAEAVGLLREARDSLQHVQNVQPDLNGYGVRNDRLNRITTHLKERPDGQ